MNYRPPTIISSQNTKIRFSFLILLYGSEHVSAIEYKNRVYFSILTLHKLNLKTMNIIEVHYEGGILFMSVLSLFLLGTLILGILGIMRKQPTLLKISQELGLLALVWGVLGQVIGLFGAFQAIEIVGEVSQEIMAGGLKVSSYTTIYGLIIFIVSKLIKLVALSMNKE